MWVIALPSLLAERLANVHPALPTERHPHPCLDTAIAERRRQRPRRLLPASGLSARVTQRSSCRPAFFPSYSGPKYSGSTLET
jgi:hypothetical protein